MKMPKYIVILVICWLISLVLFFSWLIIILYPGYQNNQQAYIADSGGLEEALTTLRSTVSTPTTFQPHEMPAEPLSSLIEPLAPSNEILMPTQSIPKLEDWQPSYEFNGIDFSRREEITIKIIPKDDSINNGKAIKLVFLPGRVCKFGDNKACVYAYKPTLEGNSIFVSIHSGIGGEGESYRKAVEGTFINSAAYSLRKINARLMELTGAQVIISQGDLVVSNLELVISTRIPPQSLNKYYKIPLHEVLQFSTRFDLQMAPTVRSQQPQIIFETCGWKNWEEPWVRGVTSTSASIYLSVIQQVQ